MFFLLLALIIFGVLCGVLFGLIPGLHPNFLVLFIPIFASLGVYESVVFVVSVVVANTLAEIIPSVFLAAPDAGSELAVFPGHRMFLRGKGYDAAKVYAMAGYFSLLLCIALLPLLLFFIPAAYGLISPYIWLLLLGVVCYMVLCEKKKLAAFFVFVLCSFIGVAIGTIPESNVLILFPVFAGLFGASIILLQMRKKSSCFAQITNAAGQKSILSSLIGGTCGGIAAGFLPGVGTSQIASFASAKNGNDESFLATMGSIAASNILVSVLALWLIEKSRSGAAVILDNVVAVIGTGEIFLVITSAMIAASLSLVFVMFIAKRASGIVARLNYNALSVVVFCALLVLVFLTTWFVGLFVFFVCLSVGIFTNMVCVKRGLMMAVLITPTILFLLPF